MSKIFTAIPAIMSDIEAIKKTKKQGSQIQYAYRGIDEFMNALNPLMAKHKVTLMPEVLRSSRERFQTAKGAEMMSVVMDVKYTLSAEDGSSTYGVTIGEAFDSGDKASNKAMSIALKYFVMQVFMVPTEDIEDPDHHDTSKALEKPVKEFSPTAELKKVLEKPKNDHPLQKFDEIDPKELSSYVIKGGKYQGKAIGDVDPFDLNNYVQWMRENSHGGMKLNAGTSEFLEKAEAYIHSIELKKAR